MRFALDIAPIAELADPALLVRLAVEAEAAGWDGVFLWDQLQGALGWQTPIADAWVTLSAIAGATRRVRLGPDVLAVPRRRPWLVARSAATLDHLSGGRLILGVGMGFPPDAEYAAFGEDGSAAGRAARLDEALTIIAALWTGQPMTHDGPTWQLSDVTLLPTPVQQPRIPIWVAVTWPRTGGYARAARWDGVCPMRPVDAGKPDEFTPEEVATLRADILRRRAPADADRPFDVVVGGETGADATADVERIRALEAAGATWWVEAINPWRGGPDELLARVRQGPPPV